MTNLFDSPVQKISGSSDSDQQNFITVHVWDVFLSKSKHNLQSTLETYSLDCTPDAEGEGTHAYRFTCYDWNKTLCELLERNNIPVIIHESSHN